MLSDHLESGEQASQSHGYYQEAGSRDLLDEG